MAVTFAIFLLKGLKVVRLVGLFEYFWYSNGYLTPDPHYTLILNYNYSGDLHTDLVLYLNGREKVGRQMVGI